MRNSRFGLAALLALTLAAGASLPLAAAPPTNHKIGDFLWSQGVRTSTFLSSCPVALQVHTVRFDPSSPWNGSDSRGSYLKRWGYINEGCHDGDASQRAYDPYLFSNGTRAPNHLTAQMILPELRALARRADNPLGLINWQAYEPDLQDAQDCLVVAWRSGTAWEGLIEPLIQAGAPATHPPPTCPSCPTCPAPVACPPAPIAPPPPVCLCAPAGQKFIPNSASSGRMTVVLMTANADGSCPPC